MDTKMSDTPVKRGRPTGKVNYSEKTRVAIIEEYFMGQTAEYLATKYGTTKQYVYNLARH